MFRGLLVDRTRSTGLGLKLILEGETPGDWGDPASSASHTNAMNDIATQNDGDLQSLHDESATSTEYRNLVEEVM